MLLENISSQSSSSESFIQGSAAATIRSRACFAQGCCRAFCRARAVNSGGNIALAVFSAFLRDGSLLARRRRTQPESRHESRHDHHQCSHRRILLEDGSRLGLARFGPMGSPRA